MRSLIYLTLTLPFSVYLLAKELDGLPHAFDAGWQGAQTCEVVFENDAILVGRCVFPPGVGHEKHYHNPHFGYVIQGSTLRITDANGTRDVDTVTGGTWSTDSVTVHEALNVGEVTTSYLIVEPRHSRNIQAQGD